MRRELYYLPVERYRSRWTEYVSGADGMWARGVHEAGRDVELKIIAPDNDVHEIKHGVVLDTYCRAKWGFRQTLDLLTLIQSGRVTDDSVIYIEDFWHPGMEMIPYACQLSGVQPSVYTFCHAQSVDPNDFTYPMRGWMRGFEYGWAKWLTGIFVADKALKYMLANARVDQYGSDTVNVCAGLDQKPKFTVSSDFAGVRLSSDGVSVPIPALCLVPMDKIHVCGTVFRRQSLIDRYDYCAHMNRRQEVLYTSRFDKEKNPDFFYAVADEVHKSRADIEFIAISGRQAPSEHLGKMANHCVRFCLASKGDYFSYLNRAAVMFNCADQDFVGYCQLDALAYGCAPLCPKYLTFPDLMRRDERYLYQHKDVKDAAAKIIALVDQQCSQARVTTTELYSRFGAKYEGSVRRQLDVMLKEPGLS